MNLICSRWIFTVVLLCLFEMRTNAATRTWDGDGGNLLANTAANWAEGTAPTNDDQIVLNAASHSNLTWNLDITAASWQQIGYTGTVTFLTKFPAGGSFDEFTISGNCTISNGVWTHPANSGVSVEYDRLQVYVGGDFILGTSGQINANGKGYAATKGPGAGGNGIYSAGATHGGIGGKGGSRNTYGSIVSPTNHGSGAGSRGGGTIRLNVAGNAHVNGTISSIGVIGTGNAANTAAAGGSIWITTGTLSGIGTIDASGLNGNLGGGGGGGRVSVVLTNGSTFGSVQMRAQGGGISNEGAAGTVYRETQDQPSGHGTLFIVNAGRATLPRDATYTLMPAAGQYAASAVNLDDFAEIVISNKGVLAVNTDTILTNFNPMRLVCSGPDHSFLALHSTNAVTFPNNLVVSNYTLFMDVPATLPGDMTIVTNSRVSHSVNSGAETYKINLTIPGNLTIRQGGEINANEAGFSGPYHVSIRYNSASHAGRGQWVTDASNVSLTYGSVLAPTNLGSHASYRGGGAILLIVAGTTTLHGIISARGQQIDNNESNGSGGSILLETGHLEGSGIMDAMGGRSRTNGGGGGRIAVILRNSDSFGNVVIKAFGGEDYWSTRTYGAAGTIYRQTQTQGSGRGDLIITSYAHNYTSKWNTVYTELPAVANASAAELRSVTLRALTNCTIGLSANLVMHDLYLMRNDTKLFLNGFTLHLLSKYHDDWGTTNRVVYNGGRITWTTPGTVIQIR